MKGNEGLELAVGHLNAAVGLQLTAAQLACALRAGTFYIEDASRTASALIASLFVEVSASLILRCATEAGADIAQVNQLYKESIAASMPRVKSWEQAVEHLL